MNKYSMNHIKNFHNYHLRIRLIILFKSVIFSIIWFEIWQLGAATLCTTQIDQIP
jgi:hypothetical protein